MTTKEFKSALKIALDSDVSIDLAANTQHFNGFALKDFTPVCTTIYHVAALIRWQCGCLFNTRQIVDFDALDEIRYWGRKRFIIVG